MPLRYQSNALLKVREAEKRPGIAAMATHWPGGSLRCVAIHMQMHEYCIAIAGIDAMLLQLCDVNCLGLWASRYAARMTWVLMVDGMRLSGYADVVLRYGGFLRPNERGLRLDFRRW
jgi:hypothetical protein